ncbi:DnaJ domain [Trypanosoma vivax]|uniref:Putative chaperone protein DNAj n=1 Tax=Trypanosoma vivax (strain Y486) TaxID=1055687 RepID=G0TWY1_TRYVY|nr:putative chaperone protein DNAj [Trypanosoma vivax]KAH8613752.1 DnaJ domain [Trypanosoma vivax]CCC48470.1 putative chaperone protein DNAj [Trypanosoma vivax Y486]
MQEKIRHLYRTLGVTPKATQDEIRKAFHALAVQFHPDRPTGCIKKFQEVQSAYEVLSNERSRHIYDSEMEMKRCSLHGFKRPPPLDHVQMPVYYSLANGELYTFESAACRLKCTFKHGDIISSNNKLGCFVGLAGDDFYYWRQDGQMHASRLCQRGSFGVDCIKILVRANFKSTRAPLPRSFVPTNKKGDHEKERNRNLSSGSQSRLSPDASTPNVTGVSVQTAKGVSSKSKQNVLTEAERLRNNIIQRERLRRLRELVPLLFEKEKCTRERLIEKATAKLEDLRLEFKTWLVTGGTKLAGESDEAPSWIVHAKKRSKHIV